MSKTLIKLRLGWGSAALLGCCIKFVNEIELEKNKCSQLGFIKTRARRAMILATGGSGDTSTIVSHVGFTAVGPGPLSIRFCCCSWIFEYVGQVYLGSLDAWRYRLHYSKLEVYSRKSSILSTFYYYYYYPPAGSKIRGAVMADSESKCWHHAIGPVCRTERLPLPVSPTPISQSPVFLYHFYIESMMLCAFHFSWVLWGGEWRNTKNSEFLYRYWSLL